MNEEKEISTTTTFNTIDFGFVLSVIKAWIFRHKLTIINPHTTLTITPYD